MILCQIEFIVTRPSSHLWDAAMRDLTKLRRKQQLQKAIGLVSKQQLCTCITIVCTFFCRPCTTTRWNDNILSFFEDGNGKAINSIISVWTWVRPPLFSSNINSLFLSNCATWDNREMVGKDAESIWFFSEVFMDAAVVVSNCTVGLSWRENFDPVSYATLVYSSKKRYRPQNSVIVQFETTPWQIKSKRSPRHLDLRSSGFWVSKQVGTFMKPSDRRIRRTHLGRFWRCQCCSVQDTKRN